MLAYVFLHWKRADVATGAYALRQRAFHGALAAAPPPGFHGSFSVVIPPVPWAVADGEIHEDWYLVRDFEALGRLNEAAVSNHRAVSHDAAAAVAAGGVGGLYALRQGTVSRRPRYAHWFAKPAGMAYGELFVQLAPLVEQASAAVWMRQMVLGPAGEFCVHAAAPLAMPAALDTLVVPLRPAWPDLADGGMESAR